MEQWKEASLIFRVGAEIIGSVQLDVILFQYRLVLLFQLVHHIGAAAKLDERQVGSERRRGLGICWWCLDPLDGKEWDHGDWPAHFVPVHFAVITPSAPLLHFQREGIIEMGTAGVSDLSSTIVCWLARMVATLPTAHRLELEILLAHHTSPPCFQCLLCVLVVMLEGPKEVCLFDGQERIVSKVVFGRSSVSVKGHVEEQEGRD